MHQSATNLSFIINQVGWFLYHFDNLFLDIATNYFLEDDRMFFKGQTDNVYLIELISRIGGSFTERQENLAF